MHRKWRMMRRDRRIAQRYKLCSGSTSLNYPPQTSAFTAGRHPTSEPAQERTGSYARAPYLYVPRGVNLAVEGPLAGVWVGRGAFKKCSEVGRKENKALAPCPEAPALIRPALGGAGEVGEDARALDRSLGRERPPLSLAFLSRLIDERDLSE